MAQDFYEILQVHPRADRDAITAAYKRLRDLYDPARLAGAADELVTLAQRKRDAIEQAYATLSDAQRRAVYDRELAEFGSEAVLDDAEPASATAEASPPPLLDYRPLPPAKRTERPKDFSERPVLAPMRQRGRAGGKKWPSWTGPAVMATVIVLLFPITYLLTGGGGPAVAPPTPTPSVFDQYEASVQQFKTIVDNDPKNAKAWVDYGNALYDSAQILREQDQASVLYQQRLPRWLQASQAYEKALELAPDSEDSAIIRADMGASSCYYGSGTGDQTVARQGLEAARKAESAAPQDPRVLLSLGNCYVSVQPPQPQEAVKVWQRITQIAPQDSQLAAQARQLIERYQ